MMRQTYEEINEDQKQEMASRIRLELEHERSPEKFHKLAMPRNLSDVSPGANVTCPVCGKTLYKGENR